MTPINRLGVHASGRILRRYGGGRAPVEGLHVGRGGPTLEQMTDQP
jgi:hypothetical protein